MEGLELWDVIKIAAGSGVVAACINQGFQWLKDYRKAKGEAQYCAVQLIAKLELYAIECADNVAWHRRVMSESRSVEPKDTCCPPEMTWLEDRLDILDPGSNAAVSWLSTEVRLAQGVVKSNWDDDLDPDSYAAERISVVGYFGYKAIELADGLRLKYDLPPLISDWSLERTKSYLKQCWEQAKKYLK